MTDPARTADVLCREVLARPADLLILQEADAEAPPHPGILDLSEVETRAGLTHAHLRKIDRWGAESHGFHGVILLAGPHVRVEDLALVDLPGQCHRGAVIADVTDAEGRPIRVVGTHLALSQLLRIVQMRTLGQHLARRRPRPTVLCGDLNEWRPWGGMALSRTCLGLRFEGPAPATFPVRRPILPLDRCLAAQGARVARVEVLDGPGIRNASDHRPLRAEIALSDPPPA